MEKLISALREEVGPLTKRQFVDEVEHPDWGSGFKCHNWMNHVPDSMKSLWGELSLETKLCILWVAEIQANQEEWD